MTQFFAVAQVFLPEGLAWHKDEAGLWDGANNFQKREGSACSIRKYVAAM